MLFRFIALAGLLFCSIVLYPQDTAVNGGGKMAEKYINTATIRCEKVDEKITAQSRKVLNKMQREEEKLRKQLFKIDSAAAKVLFAESPAKYAELRNKLTEKGGKIFLIVIILQEGGMGNSMKLFSLRIATYG